MKKSILEKWVNIPTMKSNLANEYLHFLKKYKAWWLVPVISLIFLLGGLILIASSKAIIFIYALF